jgi:hypothetical protein
MAWREGGGDGYGGEGGEDGRGGGGGGGMGWTRIHTGMKRDRQG